MLALGMDLRVRACCRTTWGIWRLEALAGTGTCPKSPKKSVAEAGLALEPLPFYVGVFLLHPNPPAVLNSYILF